MTGSVTLEIDAAAVQTAGSASNQVTEIKDRKLAKEGGDEQGYSEEEEEEEEEEEAI